VCVIRNWFIGWFREGASNIGNQTRAALGGARD
jgi:hypothetical protein